MSSRTLKVVSFSLQCEAPEGLTGGGVAEGEEIGHGGDGIGGTPEEDREHLASRGPVANLKQGGLDEIYTRKR
jgi:hypothetical protein